MLRVWGTMHSILLPITFLLTLTTVSSGSASPRYVPSFHWTRPFPYDNSAPLNTEAKCEVTKTFRAEQWTLRDLQAPSPWLPAIETYTDWHPAYPGSWEGLDLAGTEREYLVMDWVHVPVAVRSWVERMHAGKEAEGKGRWWLFGVFERPGGADGGGDGTEDGEGGKVLLFAPAALYEVLPLWVAEGSECEAEMLDLANYASHPADNSVIAWPVNHQVPEDSAARGKKDISFDIKAFYVAETEHGRAWRQMWEKTYRSIRRQERRQKREDRAAKRGQLDAETESHARDEL